LIYRPDRFDVYIVVRLAMSVAAVADKAEHHKMLNTDSSLSLELRSDMDLEVKKQ
jgi:hypothetical protein